MTSGGWYRCNSTIVFNHPYGLRIESIWTLYLFSNRWWDLSGAFPLRRPTNTVRSAISFFSQLIQAWQCRGHQSEWPGPVCLHFRGAIWRKKSNHPAQNLFQSRLIEENRESRSDEYNASQLVNETLKKKTCVIIRNLWNLSFKIISLRYDRQILERHC